MSISMAIAQPSVFAAVAASARRCGDVMRARGRGLREDCLIEATAFT